MKKDFSRSDRNNFELLWLKDDVFSHLLITNEQVEKLVHLRMDRLSKFEIRVRPKLNSKRALELRLEIPA